MSRESTKTNRVRDLNFKKKYFEGSVLDIGCGYDPVVSHAVPFDSVYGHGDANNILKYFSPASFDRVHSSHCLEHMRDPIAAAKQWWDLVRPVGYMIVVVPDEDLYEQGFWPSRFNADHKHTFRWNKKETWSPVSCDVEFLAGQLKDAGIVSIERHDHGYVHSLQWPRARKVNQSKIVRKLVSLKGRVFSVLGISSFLLSMFFDYCLGFPVDQTLGKAMAQIQIVLHKKKSLAENLLAAQ